MRSLAVILVSLVLVSGCASSDTQPARRSTLAQSVQQAMGPDVALARLAEGNERYQKSMLTSVDYSAQRKASVSGQYPMAFVLSCVDSRVIPEALFDCSIGDLFVGRVAGNVVSTDILGSMEFATKAVGTPLIVVLGHSACGAVKGACDGVDIAENLTALLSKVKPAIDMTEESGDRSSKNTKFVDAVIQNNVTATMRLVQERSPVIRELVSQGKVKVIGGVCDIGSGAVTWVSE